jgi:lipopolysaccharide export system permease protein
MVRRFTIYILWEIGKLFVVALTAFTTLIMLVGVVQQLINERLSPLAIIGLIPYILPISLQYALPATLLFAVCSVYGRVAADNEILAVKAAGVPPMKIIAPTLILGLLFSPLAVWTMDLAVSWGRPGMQRVVMHHIEEVAYHTLRSTGAYSSDSGFSIYVESVEDRKLIHPEITIQGDDRSKTLTLSARWGELRFNPEKETLKVRLVDAVWNIGESAAGSWDDKEYEIPLDQAARRGRSVGKPSEIAMRQIGQEVQLQRESIRRSEEMLGARAILSLTCGRYDWLGSPAVHETSSNLHIGRERLARLHTEPWRRWASGFSCFCFVWLGVPLAIWCRTADYWSSFGVAFLPILLIYYPLFALGLEQAKDGGWPPHSVWLGNLALLAVGGWYLHKVHYN